ncbi:MAG: hypothetical protein ACRENK_16470 [Gemmatimonadaceae bacterium]
MTRNAMMAISLAVPAVVVIGVGATGRKPTTGRNLATMLIGALATAPVLYAAFKQHPADGSMVAPPKGYG